MSKLYATATSEKASKGQGGQDYIQVKFTVKDNPQCSAHELGIITLRPREEGGYILALDRSSYGIERSWRVYEEIIKIENNRQR